MPPTGLNFTELENEVTEEETVVAGASSLLDKLFAEVEAHKGDPAALTALVARGRAATAALSAAVLKNTEAATVEPPLPEPPAVVEPPV